MPNYSFVVNATYDPLTFEEIERVPLRAAAFHSALQDKYDEAKMTTQMYDMLIPKDDPEYARSRAALDEYLNALNSGADALMNNGAWGQRDVLSGVRDIYGRRMIPVINAWTKRDEQEKEQRALLAKNPLLKFSRRASATGLDSYLDNPYLSYEQMDPAVAANMVNTMATTLQQRLNSDSSFEEQLLSLGVDQETIAHVKRYGLSPDMIPQWRNNPILRNIIGTALRAQGMDIDEKGFGKTTDTWDAKTTESVIPALETALWGAVGKDEVSFDQNHTYLENLRASNQAALAAAKSDSPDMAQYFLPHNDHFSLDDSLTDGYYIDKLKNAASAFGVHYDKDKDRFVEGSDRSLSAFVSDIIPGAFAEATPFVDGYTEIREKLAKDNGWSLHNGQYYKDKAHTKRVGAADYADALTTEMRNRSGSYHSMQDISLTSYNDAFRGVQVYPFHKIGKNGAYDADQDHPIPISSVIGAADVASVNVGVDMTDTNNGIVLKVSRGGKYEYYHVKTDSINSSAIRSAAQAVRTAASELNRVRKEMGLSKEEWTEKFVYGTATDRMGDVQRPYVEAVKSLMEAIGGANTVSNINLNQV